GSKVVTEYLQEAGLMKDLDSLGFNLVGYGCTTCIGNSGPLPPVVSRAVNEGKLVAAAVLSGNRNFEGRVKPDVQANYLASPPLKGGPGAEGGPCQGQGGAHLYPGPAVLRVLDPGGEAAPRHPGRARVGGGRRFRHHRPHLPRGGHRLEQPGGTLPRVEGDREEGLQLLRIASRERPRDGARHLREHPPQEPDGPGSGGRGHRARPLRRARGHLRRGRALPEGRDPPGGDRGEGVRERVLAGLGGQGDPAPGG